MTLSTTYIVGIILLIVGVILGIGFGRHHLAYLAIGAILFAVGTYLLVTSSKTSSTTSTPAQTKLSNSMNKFYNTSKKLHKKVLGSLTATSLPNYACYNDTATNMSTWIGTMLTDANKVISDYNTIMTACPGYPGSPPYTNCFGPTNLNNFQTFLYNASNFGVNISAPGVTASQTGTSTSAPSGLATLTSVSPTGTTINGTSVPQLYIGGYGNIYDCNDYCTVWNGVAGSAKNTTWSSSNTTCACTSGWYPTANTGSNMAIKCVQTNNNNNLGTDLGTFNSLTVPYMVPNLQGACGSGPAGSIVNVSC
jgi:hypothetical protein